MVEFEEFLNRLEISVKESEVPVIVAGDFNFKSGSWGSSIEDARRILLAELMASMDLTACNQGSSPTFVRGNSKTYIDVTFVRSQLVAKVHGWRVLEAESLSLHKYISFSMYQI
jgi:endonuclease/exonuclease/phosphatase family metal-dependent hydrolase